MRRRNLLHLLAGGAGTAGAALLGGCTNVYSQIVGSQNTCSTGEYGQWCHPRDSAIESVTDDSVFAIARPSDGEAGEVLSLDAESGDVQWSYGHATGQDGFADLTVADGVYFSSCSDQGCHRLNALTIDGDERWTRDVAADTPMVDDGTVFVGNGAPRVHALNQTNGATRWTTEFDGRSRARLVAVDDVVHVSRNDALLALDRDDGSTRWRYQVPLDGIVYDAIVENGVEYVLTTGGAAVLEDGEPRWERSFEDTTAKTRIDAVTPDLLLLSRIGRDHTFRLHALDVETGDPAWKTDRVALPFEVGDEHVKFHDGVVYVAANELRALDLATGRELWSGVPGGAPVYQLLIASESVPQEHALLAQVGESSLATVTLDGEERLRTSLESRIGDVVDGDYVYAATDEAIHAVEIPDT